MKQKFSTSWTGSKQPRKQRKYRHNAPLHVKHRFLSAHLSAELRKEHGKRSMPLRKGDEVLVMRGKLKGQKGKILEIDLIRSRVSIENVTRSKKDGTKVNVFFDPSKLKIDSLSLEDIKRTKRMKKKQEKKDAPEKK